MKTLLAAVLLAGTALGNGSVARAAAVTADCGFDTIAQQDITGGSDTFTGAAYGYAVSDTPGASISVSCEVRVNGGTVAATPAGPAGQGSVAIGQVTYVATDTDTVALCAVWSGSESGEICGATQTAQIPPQELVDLVDVLDASGINAVMCPIFASLSPGVPGVFDIAPDGDIRSEAVFWDCPPYGNGDGFAASAAADPLVCVEWWQPASHPWIHLAPCHSQPAPPSDKPPKVKHKKPRP